mgnify:CR=1 FL=1
MRDILKEIEDRLVDTDKPYTIEEVRKMYSIMLEEFCDEMFNQWTTIEFIYCMDAMYRYKLLTPTGGN